MTDETKYELYDVGVMDQFELLGKVYKSTLPPQSLYSYLKHVKENRESFRDMREHLAGVANSQLSLYDTQLNRSETITPFEMIETFRTDLDPHLIEFVGERPWVLESMWVNIMRPGDFQPMHMHTGGLSFVWYLEVPQAIYENNDAYQRPNEPDGGTSPYGEIHFMCPDQWCPFSISREMFRPKTGDLLVFDARYRHTVHPFTADVERISISGNINFVPHVTTTL